jgi:hypothetical protein
VYLRSQNSKNGSIRFVATLVTNQKSRQRHNSNNHKQQFLRLLPCDGLQLAVGLLAFTWTPLPLSPVVCEAIHWNDVTDLDYPVSYPGWRPYSQSPPWELSHRSVSVSANSSDTHRCQRTGQIIRNRENNFRRGHGCLSRVNVAPCQIQASTTGWSLVLRRPTDCLRVFVCARARMRSGQTITHYT